MKIALHGFLQDGFSSDSESEIISQTCGNRLCSKWNKMSGHLQIIELYFASLWYYSTEVMK